MLFEISELARDYIDPQFSGTYNSDTLPVDGVITFYSGINNTGTVVGSFVNIFGSGFPSKFIPSYSWGGGNAFETYKFEKAIELANIVMKRRGVELDETTIEIYKSFFK